MSDDTPARTGRPRKALTEEQLPELAVLATWARKRDAAARLGMSVDTLRRILRDDEAAARAWDLGRAGLHEKLVNKLVERALAGEVVPLLFCLKSMFGYREGEPLDGDERAPLVTINLPQPLSPEQYRARLSEMRRTLTIAAECVTEDGGNVE